MEILKKNPMKVPEKYDELDLSHMRWYRTNLVLGLFALFDSCYSAQELMIELCRIVRDILLRKGD